MQQRLFHYLLVLGGLACIGSAFFARQLGIDNNDGWGRGRTVLILAGLFFWLWLAWLLSGPKRRHLMQRLYNSASLKTIRRFWLNLTSTWKNSFVYRLVTRFYHAFLNLPGIRWLAATSLRRARFWAVLGLFVTLCFYIYLATAGTFNKLVPSSGFFDMQARAFLAGQIHLLETPPEQLLALDNPYSVEARQSLGSAYIWDASLYHGHYYLYWGPVPALLAAAYRAVSGSGLGDESLALLFLCLLAWIETLWILELHQRYFGRVRSTWLMLFVLTIGLANPIPFDIARLMVYEASILSGQFFMLAGLLCLVKGFSKDGSINSGWWLSAGLLLGLSLSARINLLPVIFWLGLMLLLHLWNRIKTLPGNPVKAVLAAGGTFALVMISIMAYNFIRFDSPFEFGSRYQLTVTDINHAYNTVLSAAYIFPNLYAYLLRPPVLIGRFPFMYADWLTDAGWPFFIRIPAGYFYTDPVLGLLVVTPFIWLILPAVYALFMELRQVGIKSSIKIIAGSRWIVFSLTGMGLIGFVFILFFYYPAMRYLTDATPALLLLAIYGAMSWLDNPSLRAVKGLVILLLALTSIVAGILLGINGPHDFFEQANPALYHGLINFFKTIPYVK
ncbi:MAG: hypothetical protein LWX83_11260 [Anaerolineae bacterium]|nr:hypothetical protein [Anaerolineae bacterium]